MNKADLVRLFMDSFDKFSQKQIDALAGLIKTYVETSNEKVNKTDEEKEIENGK